MPPARLLRKHDTRAPFGVTATRTARPVLVGTRGALEGTWIRESGPRPPSYKSFPSPSWLRGPHSGSEPSGLLCKTGTIFTGS